MMRPPCPCRTIARAAAWARKNEAFRLTSCWMSQSASLTSKTLLRRISTAAVCTRTSRPPNSATTRSTSALCPATGLRSWPMARCGPPSISATTASACALSEIDRRDAGAGGGEGERSLPADAACGAGQQNRFSLQPRAEIERHVLISRARHLPAGGATRRLFLNEAGLGLPHEFLSVLDQHGPKRLGRERLLRRLDAVEPRLRRRRPRRPPRASSFAPCRTAIREFPATACTISA